MDHMNLNHSAHNHGEFANAQAVVQIARVTVTGPEYEEIVPA